MSHLVSREHLRKAQFSACKQIERFDLDYAPFVTKGGLGRAWHLFGERLEEVMRELNEVLAS